MEDLKEAALAWMQGLEDPGQKFALGAKIGFGNTSEVREATQDDGSSVAIKIIEESDELIEAIYEEHHSLSTMGNGNPRFPTFMGAYRNMATVPSQIWFVMELCEEGSVKELLLKLKEQERFLKEDIIAYILRETLQGIKELHEQSIIHRDIKAANILVNKDGAIKICDFGSSKRLESPEGKLKTVIGCPYWMSPEIVSAERSPENSYDSRADVWSIGITAIELGDCDPPNSDVYAPRVLFQILQNPPPTLKRTSDWTQLYNDFIGECLEKNPDHRAWSAELVEHTFITDITEREEQVRKSLLHLINEQRSRDYVPPVLEITVRGDMIQMDRKSAPQPMYRDDLATIDCVSDEGVMETLNQRFAQGNIYTFLGDILIMINPFHEYTNYGSEVASKYKYRARCDNAPHIYAVADRAYQDMLHHKEVQNIVLTGETGSGKSSSAKHLLWHLANMTASNKKMVDRILKVSTVMEAFGNAATIFNTNSTRHIQYLELTFTKTGKLSGGILWAYCLEKWRVTSCARSQSNFHIFYYLMDSLINSDQTEKYNLDKGKNYNYLPASPAHTPSDNVDKLREVKEAFHVLDFALEDQETIVKILAAILLIGQIQFKPDELEDSNSGVEIQNMDVVDKIADLLQVDGKKLGWTFTNYCVISGGSTIYGKTSLPESEELRDSLSRSLYCRLVDWIVNLINTKLAFTRLVFGDHHSLGILDIPGFECFAHDNTLDQFLVNMTNEQMQFFYNQRIFMWEMQDYEKEEIAGINYNYHDNRELLDAVLSKPCGVLAFLDEETKTAGNDHRNFLEQIEQNLQTRFVKNTDASSFTVSHYSGQVIYDARNFVERNKNFLSPEMIQVMRLSGNSRVVQLFSNLMTKTGNLTIAEEDTKQTQTKWTTALAAKPQHSKKFNTKSRGKYSQSRQMQTIAATMRNSLLEMLQKVSDGSAHFVRCLRSNLKSTPFCFDRDLIRYQIRALGIVETVRARQMGYPRRLKFSEFLRRYKFLAFDFDETVEETSDNCRLLLIRLKLEGWSLGKNRVMLKHYNEEFLSRLYEHQVHKVVKIQSMMRAFLARKRINKKFPRLAEIRQDGDMELKAVKKSMYGSKSNSNGYGKPTKPVVPTYNRVYPNVGYSGVVKMGKGPSPTPLQGRSEGNKNYLGAGGDDDERPPSPRDIAAKFEQFSRETSHSPVSGRYSPNPRPNSASSGYLKGGSSGGVSQKLKASSEVRKPGNLVVPSSRPPVQKPRSSSTPEIINPMEEFTNMASKMMPELDSEFEDYGPFNFKGMLKKTGNINMSRSNPSTIMDTSAGVRPPVYSSNINSNKANNNKPPVKSPRKNISAPSTPQSEAIPGYVYCKQGPAGAGYYPSPTSPTGNYIPVKGGGSKAPAYYPLPGMVNAFPSAANSRRSSETSSVALPAGLVLEGEVEDL